MHEPSCQHERAKTGAAKFIRVEDMRKYKANAKVDINVVEK